MSNLHPTSKQQTTTSRSARHRAPQTTTRSRDAEVQAVWHESTLDTLVHILDTYFALKAKAREERVIQW